MQQKTKSLEKGDILAELIDNGDVANYSYFHNLFDRRTIVINEEIDDSILHSAILPLQEMDNDGTLEPITIIIHSPGGSVFDSLCLCNIIEKLKTPTTIITTGYAYSMGFILAIAGNNNPNVTTKCYPFSSFMFHAGSLNFSGTVGQTKNFMNFNDKIEEQVRDFILTHTKITADFYDKNKDNDQWLTSQEALEYGIVQAII